MVLAPFLKFPKSKLVLAFLLAVEDLNLNAVESLKGVGYIAIGKHLCGPATGNSKYFCNWIIAIAIDMPMRRSHYKQLCARYDLKMLHWPKFQGKRSC